MSSIVIAGAGIFGLTAALELHRRGHTVSLFDPGPVPHPLAASTDISKVIRMDYGPDEFYMDLMEVAFSGWEAWNREWPVPLYHQTGMLFLADREMQAGDFEHESFVRLQRRGYPLRRLNAKILHNDFPAWNTARWVDGYFNPRAGWAESAAVVAQLARLAAAEGVGFHEGKTFASLLEQRTRVVGIRTTDGEQYTADFVIVASGAWTPVLLPQLADRMWAVGQPVLHFHHAPVADYQPPHFPVWAAGIHSVGWYGFPARQDGLLKIANHGPGRRVDPRGERTIPASVVDDFRQFLSDSLPELAEAPLVGTRLCLYCDTFDGNFWIDHDPQREGLLACAGGSGHAFKFAPVLGSIIADVLEHKENRWAQRFAWREPPISTDRTVETGRHEKFGEESPTPRK